MHTAWVSPEDTVLSARSLFTKTRHCMTALNSAHREWPETGTSMEAERWLGAPRTGGKGVMATSFNWFWRGLMRTF